MNKQINVRLPMQLREQATVYAKKKGYDSLQELITTAIREKINPPEFTHAEMHLIEKLVHKTLTEPSFTISEAEFKKRHKLKL